MNASKVHQETERFHTNVDAWVRDSISARPISFADFLRCLPGVFPTTALHSLHKLAMTGDIPWREFERIRSDATLKTTTPRNDPAPLPAPHPLDYEWRFTKSASNLLLDVSYQLASKGEPLLLFGTPRIAYEALLSTRSRAIVFLGEDNIVTQRLLKYNRLADNRIDIMHGSMPDSMRSRAGAVIVDPPWYLDYFRPMMTTAVAACRLFGFILVSLPPKGARSSATRDRYSIYDLASNLGLELISEQPLVLDYETPFFEANTLSTAGLIAPTNWRRGDLAIFQKVRSAAETMSIEEVDAKGWCEFEIGGMRLRIRRDGRNARRSPPLLQIVEGDVLPTVSRKNADRRRAQIWTSGNRVFACGNTRWVMAAASRLVERQSESGYNSTFVDTIEERDEFERVSYDLETLARVEASEESGWRSPRSGDGDSVRFQLP